MEKTPDIFDITVIGGGPAGLFTAFYAGLRQTSVKVIESLPELGGQLTALYPEKYIYDVAGFSKVGAQELVDNLIEQMNQFEITVCLGQAVEAVEKNGEGVFRITTNKENHYTRTIIITAGNGAFQPRKMNIDGEKRFEHENLHYSITNINEFEGREVALFGGGDSAVDWALMLEPIAEKITLIHRRDRFRAHEYSVAQLKQSKVNILTPYVPTELLGNEQIEKVIVKETKGDVSLELDVNDVIVNYGFISSLGPIENWGLEIEKNSILVNSKMETNIEGIYAVGDICKYEGKVNLIATGFGEAPIAVSNAKVYIDPSVRMQPLHSTSVMGDKEEQKKKAKGIEV